LHVTRHQIRTALLASVATVLTGWSTASLTLAAAPAAPPAAAQAQAEGAQNDEASTPSQQPAAQLPRMRENPTTFPSIASPPGFFGELPANANPRIMGTKVAANLVNRAFIEGRQYGVIYPEVCAAYGSIRFAGEAKDELLLNALIKRYEGMVNPPGVRAPAAAPERGGRGGAGGRGAGRFGGRRGGGAAAGGGATTQPGQFARGGGQRGGGRGNTPNATTIDPETATALQMVPHADHVDRSVFGILPMEIYRQIGDRRYLAIGKRSADEQWENPDEAGLTRQSRWWIDDMFMITALQSEAHRVTHDPVYVDRAAREMAAYLDKLQQPNGLFHHADDVPAFWGRGAGWVAAGLTELLLEMPENHPQRPRIMEGYRKMMAGLLKNQAPEGMWRQLIDNEKSWPETSGSGMFTFAMATGVRKGWLPEPEYKEAAKKAWIGLCGYLTDDGNVRDVCVGTNKYNNMANDPEGMAAYYMDRQRRTGDLHGQAAFIWAAWAMLE
jgi:rhamnogalacturonyl hydrolase YesR